MKEILNKFIINSLITFFVFESLIAVQPSISSRIYSNNNQLFFPSKFKKSNYSLIAETTNDFVQNSPILKSYGPLILDINNFKYDSGLYFIPILNIEYKPLFLAINCKESIFNIKDKYHWKEWFKPFFNYELDILNEFCSN